MHVKTQRTVVYRPHFTEEEETHEYSAWGARGRGKCTCHGESKPWGRAGGPGPSPTPALPRSVGRAPSLWLPRVGHTKKEGLKGFLLSAPWAWRDMRVIEGIEGQPWEVMAGSGKALGDPGLRQVRLEPWRDRTGP